MRIPFTKMHGLGNDFVVFDATTTPLSLTTEQIRWIAHRHFGIGCDQVLFVDASDKPDVDFRYRIFNADGNEVQQCGNGARCFARFVRDQGLTNKDHLVVETVAGRIYPRLNAQGEVTVDMGRPRLQPEEIPFIAKSYATQYPIEVEDHEYFIGAVSMGNPHAVLVVDSVETAPVATLGPQLEHHPRFPEQVNVGFMQIIHRQYLRLRVHERGVGETLACGTGACAAVVVGQLLGHLDATVTVELRGGCLQIEWNGDHQSSVLMTGAAISVFEGIIEL